MSELEEDRAVRHLTESLEVNLVAAESFRFGDEDFVDDEVEVGFGDHDEVEDQRETKGHRLNDGHGFAVAGNRGPVDLSGVDRGASGSGQGAKAASAATRNFFIGVTP